jgi:transposase InsO family protein
MGLARSTFYDEPENQPIREGRLVEQIKAVCAEWPAYGYRRVTAELHGEGRIVNHKKVMRLMKANGLTLRLSARPRTGHGRAAARARLWPHDLASHELMRKLTNHNQYTERLEHSSAECRQKRVAVVRPYEEKQKSATQIACRLNAAAHSNR